MGRTAAGRSRQPGRFHLVSLGEALLRLTPPPGEPLRRASSVALHVVGSQLNVAADLACLGKVTAFVSRLPDNPLGKLALDSIRGCGVDVSRVQLVPGCRMGATWVELGAAPRVPLAIYDRAGSAASSIGARDFPWSAILSRADFAYTDGIFPGLSAGCAGAAEAFLAAARQRGCTTCFDVNYREHLWSPREARRAWTKLLPLVDILVTNADVSRLIFGFTGSEEEVMRRYTRQFGCGVVCMTRREMIGLRRGAWNSAALAGGGVVEGTRREFEIVDRYGTGDAWCAGFLYGMMERNDPGAALEFGNALCALAHTLNGDIAHVSAAEVAALAEGSSDLRVRR